MKRKNKCIHPSQLHSLCLYTIPLQTAPDSKPSNNKINTHQMTFKYVHMHTP
uniref:Uncharacterized protein n=1 Tax=Arundo donax TaxID=35708 RepID=A0A0A9GH29_ARUDO